MYYDLYRPEMSDNQFDNNTAVYGPNIASYPTMVALSDDSATTFELLEVVSGQVVDPALEIDLVDHDGQTITTDSASKIKFIIVDASSDLDGTREAIANQGLATFDDLIFVSTPGSEAIEYQVSSNAINDQKILLQYGVDSLQDPLLVSFRYCQSGEIESEDRCRLCSPGTYSVGESQTECEFCMPHAACLGGNQIVVDKGYYRASHHTAHISECTREDS